MQENSVKARLERMIAFRDNYKGKSQVERRARRKAVQELWAMLPLKADREAMRNLCGLAK